MFVLHNIRMDIYLMTYYDSSDIEYYHVSTQHSFIGWSPFTTSVTQVTTTTTTTRRGGSLLVQPGGVHGA